MNIIEMAKEAGMVPDAREVWWNVCTHDLERFAALVRAEERETRRLPKMTDEQIWQCNSDGCGGYHICVEHQNVLDFARAIEREIGFDRANLWLKRISDAVEADRAEREWVDLTRDEAETLFWNWKHSSEYSVPLFEYRIIVDASIAAFKEKQK